MKVFARLAIVLLVLVAAGCLTPRAPPVSDARAAHPVATSGGSGSFTLRVLVTDELGGAPVAGANVVARFDASSVAVTTGDDGRAELKLPSSRGVEVTAWKHGFTLERAPMKATGSSGSSDDLSIPLYHEDVTIEIVGKLGPAGASTRAIDGSDLKWDPQRVYWSPTFAANKAYNARLVQTNVTLSWTNGPTGGGDLLIAGGRSTGHADAVQDNGQQASLGEQSEKANVPFPAIDRAGWRQADQLYVGAGTGKAWAAPLGLEYKLVIQGHFDGDLRLHASPDGGLFAALIGLGAGAFLLPRPRRP